MNLKEAFRYQSFLDRLLDETINLEGSISTEDSYNEMMSVLARILLEKGKTAAAINDAKHKIVEEKGVDIDAMIAENKYRQKILERLKKTREKFKTAQNINGNKDVFVHCSSDIANLAGDIDEVSAKIEISMLEIKLDFDPAFNMHDSVSDLIRFSVVA